MPFDKGLHVDNHPRLQPPGTWRDLQNGVINEEVGAITNEKGTVTLDVINAGYTVIGSILLDDQRTILFAANNGGASIIVEFDPSTDAITTLVDDVSWTDKLAFPETGYVEGTFRITPNGEYVIYWTDNVNPPRFLNLNQLNPTPTTIIDLETIKLFPEIASVATISLGLQNGTTDEGGVLKTGSYQFALAYVDTDLTQTNYFYVSRPVPIIDEGYGGFGSAPAFEMDGAPNDTATNYIIRLAISNIDTRYEKLRIAVIKDGIVSVLPDLYINSSSLEYIYSGTESIVEAALEDIVVDKNSYNKAKTLNQLDGVLYLGNLSKEEDIGYQKYANGIKVTPVYDEAEITSFRQSGRLNGYEHGGVVYGRKGFRRDEVYALYIAFILKDGSRSKAYHIPGRAPYSDTDDGKASGTITVNTNAPSAVNAASAQIIIDNNAPDLGAAASGGGYQFDVSYTTGDSYVIRVDVGGPTMYTTGNISILATDDEVAAADRIINALNALPGFSSDWLAVSYDDGGIRKIRLDAQQDGDEYNGQNIFITDIPDSFSTANLNDHITQLAVTSGGVDNDALMSADEITITSPTNPDIVITLPQIAGLSLKNNIRNAYIDALNADPDFFAEYIAEVGSVNASLRIRSKTNGTSYNGETVEITDNPSSLTYTGSPAILAGGRNNATDSFGAGIGVTLNVYGSVTSANIVGQESRFSVAQKIHAALVASGPSEYVYTLNGAVITVTAAAVGNLFNGSIAITLNDIGISITSTFLTGGASNTALYKENLSASISDISRVATEGGITSLVTSKQFHLLNIPDPVYGMGYWENANETYPNTDDFDIWEVVGGVGQTTGSTLKNSNVRHHRMPSFRDAPFYDSGNDKAQILGLKVTNVQIPDAIKNKVIGWEILYANRTPINKTIFDQDLGIQADQAASSPFDIIPQCDCEDDTNTTYTFSKKYMFLHPFRAMRTRASLGNVAFVKAAAIIDDFTTSAFGAEVQTSASYEVVPINHDNLLRVIEAKAYIEVNTDTDLSNLGFAVDCNNALGEAKILVAFDNDLTEGSGNVHNYLWNLCHFKLNVYQSFDRQELISTGYIQQDLTQTESDTFYGGDTFINYYAYKTSDNDTAPGDQGIHVVVVESDDNIDLRHEGDQPDQIYYPKRTEAAIFGVDLSDYDETDIRQIDNYIAYNEAYSLLNTIKSAFPDIVSTVEPNEFNTRIIRSQKDNSSNLSDPFRVFLPNDFIDLPRHRGELVHIATANNILIPHMKRGLFRTKGREEMSVSDIRAFIGSGDIFSVRPDEIIPTDDGYGGLQNPKTSLVTPFGYFFVDVQAKKIFLLNNQLNEISDLGIREWVKSNLTLSATNTILAGYDPVYRRIILTKYDSAEEDKDEWTLSFLPDQNIWVSFHDFTAPFYFSDVEYFYSIRVSGSIARHSVGNRGDVFGSDVVFEIEFVDNKEPMVSKIVDGLRWQSVIKSSAGVELEDTLNSYRITNDYQDTGEITISSANVRRTARDWRINTIRDTLNTATTTTLPSWMNQRRLEDIFHKVRLKFANNANKNLYLLEAGLDVRESER